MAGIPQGSISSGGHREEASGCSVALGDILTNLSTALLLNCVLG